MEQQSLLSEMEFTPVLASTGKRFLNFFIDYIIFFLLIIIVAVSIAYTIPSSDAFEYAATTTSSSSLIEEIFSRIFFLLIYGFYYFIFEMLFKGRTIGKMITGTKAVNEDGTDMSPKTILIRSLSRAVPFEVFSAFGSPCYPWHDKWTKTYVIDIKKTELNEVPV